MDPILKNLQIETHVARRAQICAPWIRPVAPPPLNRVYLVESGRGFIFYDNHTYNLEPGRMCMIPSCLAGSHGGLVDGETSMLCHFMLFSVTVLGGMDLYDYLQCEHEILLRDPDGMLENFRRMEKLRSIEPKTKAFELMELTMRILAPFLETVDEARQASLRKSILRFETVLDYVDQHLGEAIRVPDLARLVHLEPSYFSRLFSMSMGVSPERHVIQRRIFRARQMLMQFDRPLESVAHELGFTDAFHFSKTFKKLVGVPPSKYRAAAQIKSPELTPRETVRNE
jgi:AraC-like DNA-binding protein